MDAAALAAKREKEKEKLKEYLESETRILDMVSTRCQLMMLSTSLLVLSLATNDSWTCHIHLVDNHARLHDCRCLAREMPENGLRKRLN